MRRLSYEDLDTFLSDQTRLAHVLSTPAASIGIWRIEVFPMKTARFTQLLHKMPAGKIVFTLRLQRRASGDYAPDHKAMLEANQALLSRLRAAVGKVYHSLQNRKAVATWPLRQTQTGSNA